MTIQSSNRNKRGQVLLVTAFLIFVLFTLALTFFKLLPTELNSALRTKQSLRGQLIADSGIKEARVWLESQPPQSIIDQDYLNTNFNTGTQGSPILMGDTWSEEGDESVQEGAYRYEVQMTVNPTAPFTFDAVSTAFFDDQPLRQVRATLARDNFSRYALFIDRWGDLLAMETVPGAIQGPFHTNDFFKLVIPSGFYGNGAEPFVSGTNGVMTHTGLSAEGSLPFVATEGDGNEYFSTTSPNPNSAAGIVPYNNGGSIDARYESIVNGGKANMRTTNHVTLPYGADELLFRSLGGTEIGDVAIPGEIGIYVNTQGSDVAGGVFLVGDAEIRLSIDSAGNQVQTFTQAIPQEAYRFITQETVDRPVFGNVARTLDVGSRYYTSEQVTQMVDVNRIVGYETEVQVVTTQGNPQQVWQPAGNGTGTTVGSWVTVYETIHQTIEVQVPIYETVQEPQTVTVRNQITITDPNDPLIGTTVNSYEQTGTVPEIQDRINIISAEQYEQDPAAYPDAERFFHGHENKTATVTEVAGENPTTIVTDYEGVTNTYNGSLNGITFVDGSVTGLSGVSKGAQDERFPDGDRFEGRYIVANPAVGSKGKMVIDDDLLQFYNGGNGDLQGTQPFTLKTGELSPDSQHALGLISRETLLKPAKDDELYLYSVIMGGISLRGTEDENTNIPEVAGGFGAHPDIMTAGYGFNTFHLFGGLVQAHQMKWHDEGNGLTGNLKFDPAVAGDMPLFPRSNQVTTLRYADRYVDSEDSI